MQQPCKHNFPTIEGMCFLHGPCKVEAGSNTSTVSLLVVGGDEKGTQYLEHTRATLFRGDINTRTWPSRLGESRI
jgi:hypothetical protein